MFLAALVFFREYLVEPVCLPFGNGFIREGRMVTY